MIRINYGSRSFDFPRYFSTDAGWYMSAEWNTKQFFESVIKEDFTIIDAGAQIGMYAVPFSKLASKGTVYAFEPTDTVDLLKENLAHNNCDNVRVQNIALSNKDGRYLDKIFKIWSQNVVDHKEFNFTTIDTFVKNNNLRVDLIKIDVDSYDYEVLLGCEKTLKDQNPIVVVELNSALEKRGFKPDDGINFMTSIGYNLQGILDGENFLFVKGSEQDG